MNDETIVIDDSSSLTVEELDKTLEKYFYSKEETSLNSQESSTETAIIEQVQIMNERIEYQNTLLSLTCVVSFAILLLVLYYRFLKNFMERWF